MANVLLDLGTHYGQGLEMFIRQFNVDESWIVHTFEANPVTHKIFVDQHHHKYPWVVHHNEAITNYDGTISLNIESPPNEGETGQGTSIVDLEHWAPWDGAIRDNFQTTAEVPCIDFSKFVAKHFSPYDNIVVKMDIEGAEFDTLDTMIKDGTLKWINFIAVEWHSRFFTNVEEMRVREANIVQYARDNNIRLESWW